MPLGTIKQTNFTGGVASSWMGGRTDNTKYANAARCILNATVRPHGGAQRRPGTRFVTTSGQGRLVPFKVAATDTCMLVMDANRFRFGRDGGMIWVLDTDAVIVNGTFDAGISSWNDVSDPTASISWDSANQRLKLTNATAAVAWAEQAVTTSKVGQAHVLRFRIAGDSGDKIKVRVGTGSKADDILADQERQAGSITIEFTPTASPFHVQFRNDVSPAKAIAIDDVAILSNMELTLPTDYDATTVRELQWAQSADVMYIAHRGHHASKLMRHGHASWSLVPVRFNDTPDEWINNPTLAFPGSVTFFDKRLVWGNNADHPDRLWFSRAGDFEDHHVSDPIIDTDPFVRTIAANAVAHISWLSGQHELLVGTLGGVFVVRPGNRDEPISPDNATAKPHTSLGTAPVQPIPAGDRTVFIDRYRQSIQSIAYDIMSEKYKGTDMTIFGEHLGAGVKGLDFSERPDPMVWVWREDGALLSMTFAPDHEVFAWSSHRLGGGFRGGAPKVDGLAVTPTEDGGTVWLLVWRTVNGAEVCHVEVLDPPQRYPEKSDFSWAPEADVLGLWTEALADEQQFAFFVDSGLSLDRPIAITGISRANPGVVTAPGHGLINGDRVRLRGVVGMTEVNGGRYTVASATTDTFALSGVDTSSFAAYATGGEARKLETVVTGLGHLEGLTVAILVDGAVHPSRVVANGQVTLDRAAAVVHAGLPYSTRIETLPWEEPLASGPPDRRKKRVVGVTVLFLHTMGASAGTPGGYLETIPYRRDGDVMDAPPPLFSGKKSVRLQDPWDEMATMVIRQELPLPMNVLAVVAQIDIGG